MANNQVKTINDLNMSQFVKQNSIQDLAHSVLKDKSTQFLSNMLELVSNDDNLAKADNMSVFKSALIGANLNLPMSKDLGFFYIISYYNSKQKKHIAQAQIGKQGFVQLALRTGEYYKMNAVPVYESQFISWNPFTEEFKYDIDVEPSGEVVGYYGFFILNNGFRKDVYWTKKEMNNHRIQFSQFGNDRSANNAPKGVWKDHFDAMAVKTVVKNMLKKWGLLSIELTTALENDEVDPKPIQAEETNSQGKSNAEILMEEQQSNSNPTNDNADNPEEHKESTGKSNDYQTQGNEDEDPFA